MIPPGFGDGEYLAFSALICRQHGIQMHDYRSDQMRRRLQTLGVMNKCASFAELAGRISTDSKVLSQFLDHFTINVTELYRNPELFAYLEEHLLPGLIANVGVRPLEVWSAGCSYGAEAFTMASILTDLMPLKNFRIRGTDIDRSILAQANIAKFNANDMKGVPPARKEKHFMTLDEKVWMPVMAGKTCVSFGPQDLLKGPYPIAQYDVILCRNVVIYFTEQAKDRIFQGFYQALRPGGVLFVGGTERLSNSGDLGYETIRPFFYRKPADAGAMKLAA